MNFVLLGTILLIAAFMLGVIVTPGLLLWTILKPNLLWQMIVVVAFGTALGILLVLGIILIFLRRIGIRLRG